MLTQNKQKEELVEQIFTDLRTEEKIDTPQFARAIGALTEFCILANRRWKCLNRKDGSITDLEQKIHKEAGSLIRLFVAEQTTSTLSFLKSTAVPFPLLDLTMEGFLRIIQTKLKQCQISE